MQVVLHAFRCPECSNGKVAVCMDGFNGPERGPIVEAECAGNFVVFAVYEHSGIFRLLRRVRCMRLDGVRDVETPNCIERPPVVARTPPRLDAKRLVFLVVDETEVDDLISSQDDGAADFERLDVEGGVSKKSSGSFKRTFRVPGCRKHDCIADIVVIQETKSLDVDLAFPCRMR